MRKRSPVRNRVEYLLVRLMAAKLRWLPELFTRPVAQLCARILDRTAPKLRRVARTNLEFAYPDLSPEERERIIDGVFRSIGRVLFAVSRFPRINRDNVGCWIRYEGYEHFQEALRRGKGVLFATAHLGNWELSAFAHALLSAPMHVVVRPLDNPLLDAFVERRRSMSGNRVIGKRNLVRGILTALHHNEAVGILIDQNTSADEGVFVDFFGRKACADAGFARIAARTGATVIPGFALWSERERRFILHFHEPVEMTGDPWEDTQRLHSRLEEVIRSHPDQWLWIHRRWKTRPAGEPPLY